MTDAERLARVLWPKVETDPQTWRKHFVTIAQRAIDSGLVTVAPEPNPVDALVARFWDVVALNGHSDIAIEVTLRTLVAEGSIAPGPNL